MKKLLTLSLLFLLVVAAVTAQNQDDYWQTAPSPYGGDMSLTKTTNGHLYAKHLTVKRAVYESKDNGDTWEELTSITHSNIHFPGLYIGEAGNFYCKLFVWTRSVNAGITWDTMVTPRPFTKVLENGTGTLIAYYKDTIYRSTTAGQQWEIASTAPVNETKSLESISNTLWGGMIAYIAYHAPDPKCIFFRSTDDGQSWQRYETAPNTILTYIAPSGTFFFISASKLYRSTDGGQTLTLVKNPAPYGAVIHSLPGGRMLMVSYSRLYYSDDDGISWHDLYPGNVASLGFISLQPLKPLADGTIFCNNLNTLYKSKDNGLTWQISSEGIPKVKVFDAQFFNDSTYLVTTANGLWRTTNKGLDWTRILERNTTYPTINFEKTSGGGLVVSMNGDLYYSPNAIDSFTYISEPHFIDGHKFFINPSNDHLFMNGTQGFLRSFNLGQSWESTPVVWIEEMVFHPDGRMIGIEQDNHYLLLSDNEGLTWSTVTIPNVNTIYNIWLKRDGSLLAEVKDSVQAYFMKSTDAGQTWVATGGKHPHYNNGEYTNLTRLDANGHIYTIDNDAQVIVSANEGLSWFTLPNYFNQLQYPEYSFGIYLLKITPDQHLYINSVNYDPYFSAASVTEGAYVTGSVRRDADADCSTPDAQAPMKNTVVKADHYSSEYMTTTDADGRYLFFLDTGTYNITARVTNQIWWDYCDSVQTVELTEILNTDTIDFSLVALSDCPLMTVNLGAYSMRRCANNGISVKYCNHGAETADSAWVDVMLDTYLTFVSSTQPSVDLGGNTIRFLLGDVEPGDCGQFNLFAYLNCDSTILGQTHCVTAHSFPDTLCTQIPAWSGANIEARVACQDSIVQFQLQNTGPAESQILNYIIIEDDVVMFQGQHQYQPGQVYDIPIPATGHTYRIESQQEPGHPFSTLALAYEEGCGGFETLGFINQFTVNGITPSWHTICRENSGSYDPNDKQGYPGGTGAEHKIRPGQPIEYTIRFQNTGTDTAFTVLLRDTLSSWLDPASIVPGASSHPYSWQLSGQDELSFGFADILLPDSTTNLAGSQGFVSFLISQKQNVPLGTEIHNRAAIYFDYNAPVITNETWHTVGTDLLTATHDIPQSRKLNAVQVSPNPAKDAATFNLKKGSFKDQRLQVFDPMGKLVFEKTLNGDQFILPRNGFVSGAYGWRITNAQGRLVDSGILIFQ